MPSLTYNTSEQAMAIAALSTSVQVQTGRLFSAPFSDLYGRLLKQSQTSFSLFLLNDCHHKQPCPSFGGPSWRPFLVLTKSVTTHRVQILIWHTVRRNRRTQHARRSSILVDVSSPTLPLVSNPFPCIQTNFPAFFWDNTPLFALLI